MRADDLVHHREPEAGAAVPPREEGVEDARQFRRTDAGAVVALAERLELLLSIYAKGERPTGSSDPYALRRAAQGLLQILWDRGWRLNLLALLHRARTGVGQKVSVSLYNSMLAMQMQEAAMIMMADSEVNWAAMPLSGVFETQNGPLVLVGAFKANPLQDICRALALEDLSADERFCNLNQQFRNKPELQAMFRDKFASNTREHWLERLEEQDLLCAPVRDLREALVDPQTLHNKVLIEGPGEGQTVRFVGSPIQMSAAPVTLRRAPPRLGQHTQEILDMVQTGVQMS